MEWAFDFERSFGEQSEGRTDEEVLDEKGRRLLGMRMWRAGDEAIQILRRSIDTADDGPGTIAAVSKIMDEAVRLTNDFLCREFFPPFLEMVREGRIITGEVPAHLIERTWQEYDVASRARIFFQVTYVSPLALEGPESADFLEFVYRMAAVCTLLRVNDAAIAAFLDGRGLDEAGADVEWFQGYMRPPTNLLATIASAKRMAISERAAANAARAHAPRIEAREWILAEWAKYRTESNNKSEFARIYARRVKQERGLEVTEKTIREVWLRDPPITSKPAGVPAPGE